MMKEDFDRLYASLILDIGLNFKANSALLISCSYEHYEFARFVAKKAYEKGAKFVEIKISDLNLLKYRSENQNIEQMSYLPSYIQSIDEEIADDRWSNLFIADTENTECLNGSDMDKIAAYQKAYIAKVSRGKEKRMKFQVPWLIVGYPGPNWAKMTLNSTTQDMQALLEKILFLNKKDPNQAWLDYDKKLKSNNEKLNNLNIKELHYKGLGTDLRIGLRKEAIWLGGSDELSDGSIFFPNLPTCENFSVPDRLRVNGKIKTTKPVTVLNTQCEGIEFTFKDGKVIKCTAQKGQHAMDKFLESDENSRYLGEVALVEENNEIAKSNAIFNNILFDENASCHLAIGAGYPICLKNHKEINDDELLDYGCNKSSVHIDFMVGSKNLVISALTYDNKEVLIFKNGRFKI